LSAVLSQYLANHTKQHAGDVIVLLGVAHESIKVSHDGIQQCDHCFRSSEPRLNLADPSVFSGPVTVRVAPPG